MRLGSYSRILAIPGFPTLMTLAFLVRIPVAGASMAITFYVVQDMQRGYGAAGAVITASTIGTALGAPLLGKLIDRQGLRTVVLLAMIGESALWFITPVLSFGLLLPFVAAVCLLRLPIYSLTKQSITALVPSDHRRQALALDSMAVELSFMVGPALAAFLVTQYSGRVTLLAIGVAMVIACLALIAINPPVAATLPAPADPPAAAETNVPKEAGETGKPEHPASDAEPRRPGWLTPAMIIQFGLGAAALLTLSGTDVALVATLRETDQVSWTGAVFGIWCAASLLGALVYGMIQRPLSPALLVCCLGLLTIPIGLVSDWWLLALAVIPAGLFCAPSLTASTDAVTRLAPAGTLGEVLGWQGATATIGISLGAPLAGAAIDRYGAPLGYVTVGVVGVLFVVLFVVLTTAWSVVGRRAGQATSDQRAQTTVVAPSDPDGPGRAPRCGVRATPRAESADRAGDCRSTAGAGALESELR